MGTGNYVGRYQLAEFRGVRSARLHGRIDGAYVASDITLTNPLPIFSVPIKVTSAAFTIASAASIAAVKPLVSIMPNASLAILYILLK